MPVGKLIDGGIQLDSSSWVKKMVVLRSKISGSGCSIICWYVSSMLGCWVIMCWIGLCGQLDLEVMRSVRAKFLKFRGTNQ